MDCVELFAGGGGSAIGLAWAGLNHTWAVEKDTHPTARAAQAACDARLEAAGVRLCGEIVKEGATDG